MRLIDENGSHCDEKGSSIVDTTCTHMGCELQWNDAEKSDALSRSGSAGENN